jgi:septum formation protein
MRETRLILASASPRRRELLDLLGVSYRCIPAHVDESQRAGETPPSYVRRVAQEKALAVAGLHAGSADVVLAADTTVVLDDTVLGKPRDHADAREMLARLSGRRHAVFTAVCLHSGSGLHCELVKTEVEFMVLSRDVCEAYLASAEPWDKAGAYGIQGLGGALVRSIQGSYSNVVGLPLCETWQLLSANGIATALNPAAAS